MEKYEVGEEILLNSTTKNVPAKVLEVRPGGLLVFVPSTGQRLEIPYTVAVKQSR